MNYLKSDDLGLSFDLVISYLGGSQQVVCFLSLSFLIGSTLMIMMMMMIILKLTCCENERHMKRTCKAPVRDRCYF